MFELAGAQKIGTAEMCRAIGGRTVAGGRHQLVARAARQVEWMATHQVLAGLHLMMHCSLGRLDHWVAVVLGFRFDFEDSF